MGNNCLYAYFNQKKPGKKVWKKKMEKDLTADR